MNRIIDFVVFVFVVGALWWALNAILAAFTVVEPWNKLALVAFVLLVVLAIADYLRGGSWFWNRNRPQ